MAKSGGGSRNGGRGGSVNFTMQNGRVTVSTRRVTVGKNTTTWVNVNGRDFTLSDLRKKGFTSVIDELQRRGIN